VDLELAVQDAVLEARMVRPRASALEGAAAPELRRRQPEVLQIRKGAALEEQTAVAIREERQVDGHAPRRPSRPRRRMERDGAVAVRPAPARERALPAARCRWRAERLAELHEALVPVTGPIAAEETLRERAMRLATSVRSRREALEPGEH